MNPLNVLRGTAVMTPAAALPRDGGGGAARPAGRVRVARRRRGPAGRRRARRPRGRLATADGETGTVVAAPCDIIVAPVDLKLRAAIALKRQTEPPDPARRPARPARRPVRQRRDLSRPVAERRDGVIGKARCCIRSIEGSSARVRNRSGRVRTGRSNGSRADAAVASERASRARGQYFRSGNEGSPIAGKYCKQRAKAPCRLRCSV